MFNEFVKILLDRDKFDEPQPGEAGGEDQDGRYAIQVPDDLNNIYVRLLAGDRQTPIEAKNINVPIQPDYPVLVYYVKGIKTPYAIPDPSRVAEYRNDNEGLSTVAPHSHEPGFGNFDPVSTIRMREGQPSLSYPYTFYVDIAPFKYWDVNGDEQWFPGGAIDLESYVPATSNMHCFVKISLDRNTGLLEATAGADKSTLLPLLEEDLASIDISSSYKPLCGVKLHNGMTAIDDMKYLMDWRFWIADFATGGASGVSGVGGATELSELSDVLSASQTANFILAAGDGATGGEYRGRALVSNDIPSLAASKISSGTLLHERGGLEADVSAYDGLIRITGGSTSNIKWTITTADPTTGDDSGDGYSIGSRWINTNTDEEFVCTDNTLTAAVWVSTTNTSGLNDLADLDDVSSAAQTANYVLAAGDGATGGDYRGRLLVAADIPNISASKITSGLLALARGGLNVDVSSLSGFLVYNGAGSAIAIKYNITTADPTTGDDSADGYAVGSRWFNTVSGEEFVCLASSIGAAVWKSTTDTGGSQIHLDTTDPTVNDDTGDGYVVGDRWINTSTNEEFVVTDVTTGAAVWVSTTATGSTTVTFHGVKDTASLSGSTSGVPTTLILDASQEYDTDGFEVSSTEFEIPTGLTGYYRITAHATGTTSGTPSPNTGTVRLEVVGDSTVQDYRYFDDSLMSEVRLFITTEKFLNAGDNISFRITRNTVDDMSWVGVLILSLIGD